MMSVVRTMNVFEVTRQYRGRRSFTVGTDWVKDKSHDTPIPSPTILFSCYLVLSSERDVVERPVRGCRHTCLDGL